MGNTIGKMPEFTDSGEPVDEVKQGEGQLPEEELQPQEQPIEETEPVGEQEAVKPEGEEVVNEDTDKVSKQIQGLEAEKTKLLEEIKSLRGERREIKQEEIVKVEQQIDDLKDYNPDDIKVIERIAKARGFVSKDDVKTMFYKEIQQDMLNQFLDKYPEFKPENDPNDINWNALMREYKLYRDPSNPRQTMDLLERARKTVSPQKVSEKPIQPAQRQIKTASMGGGGTKGSFSSPTLSHEQVEQLRRGGWTEEEIAEINKKK